MNALETFIAGLLATLAQKAQSIGMTLATALGQIFLQTGQDERDILLQLKAKWIAAYQAEKAKTGADAVTTLTAIENASTTTYNLFCNVEGDEFVKVKAGIIAALEYAAKQAEGLLSGVVHQPAPAA